MAESHRINLSTPNSRIELFMNDICVGQVDIELKAKVTMYEPQISNKPKGRMNRKQVQKQVDMARGILELEENELMWNRKMLMDKMGYSNYRDINKFIETLTKSKYVVVHHNSHAKGEWFRSSGPGNIWLNNKKEGPLKI